MAYILPLTIRLQSPDVDIISAHDEGRKAAEVIESLRSDERLPAMYKEAVEMARSVGVSPTKKRSTVTQPHRGSVPADSIAEHFRLNLFLPFIDHVTEEPRTRFADSSEPALVAGFLVPKALPQLTEEERSFFFDGTERTWLNLRLQSRRYIDGSIFSLITLGTLQVKLRKHCRKWICNIILILNASFALTSHCQ